MLPYRAILCTGFYFLWGLSSDVEIASTDLTVFLVMRSLIFQVGFVIRRLFTEDSSESSTVSSSNLILPKIHASILQARQELIVRYSLCLRKLHRLQPGRQIVVLL